MCFVVLSVKQGRITKYKRYIYIYRLLENEQSMGSIMSKGQDCIWDGGNEVGQENYTAALRKNAATTELIHTSI